MPTPHDLLSRLTRLIPANDAVRGLPPRLPMLLSLLAVALIVCLLLLFLRLALVGGTIHLML